MPGMENFAPDRTLTSSGSAGSPSFLPMAFSRSARWLGDLVVEAVGRRAVLEVIAARVRGDDEAGRDGQAEIGHLGEVRALATKEVFEVLVTFCEVIDELRH